MDDSAIATIKNGQMPFRDEGEASLLKSALAKGLVVANDRTLIERARVVVVVIWIPLDEPAHVQVSSHEQVLARPDTLTP